MFDDSATHRNGKQTGDSDRDQLNNETEPGTNALSVPETDPERIAFNLWNEGRVDEAIQFLEQQIAARSKRYEPATPDVPALFRKLPDAVQPVSGWRERHRSALSSSDFNAFGNSVHTIDLKAGPADATLPHATRRSPRLALIMALGLIVIGLSTGAVLWSDRTVAPETTAVATAEAIEPAIVPAPAKAEPETEIAPAETGTVLPPAAPAASDEKPGADIASVEMGTVLPPSAIEPSSAAEEPETEVATAETSAVLPPEETAVAAPPPEATDDTTSEVAGVAPSDEASILDDLPPEEVTPAPETTASIDPAPIDPEAAPIAAPRVPRVRPEPPASVVRSAAVDPAPLGVDDPAPTIVDDPGPPVVGAPAQQSGYTSAPVRSFDPMNPPAMLTPAEYQALLKRRAWAQSYSQRRRAVAERRILEEEPPGTLGYRGPFFRLLPN